MTVKGTVSGATPLCMVTPADPGGYNRLIHSRKSEISTTIRSG